MAKAAKPVPDGYHTITPQLTLDNAAGTIEWYKKVLGAEEIGRHLGPDGKVMHAELKIGNSRLIVHDVMPGSSGPRALGGSPASLWVYVENCDELFRRAVAAGAEVQVPLDDQFWGDRGGAIADPEGYTWWLSTRKEDLTDAELEQRAMDFYKQTGQPQPTTP
jgi:PhnB protein